MSRPEVTEFVIIAPLAHREKLRASADRFDAWMAEEFPGYHFSVVEPAVAIEEAEVTFVLPVMNRAVEAGKWDATPMCAPPDPVVVHAITKRLEAFSKGAGGLN